MSNSIQTATYIYNLATNQPETAAFPDEFMEKAHKFIDAYILNGTYVQSILLSNCPTQTKIEIIKNRVEQLESDEMSLFSSSELIKAYESYLSEQKQGFWEDEKPHEAFQNDIVSFAKNTVTDSPISAGGDVTIGDRYENNVTINSVTEEPELRCPECKTLAPTNSDTNYKNTFEVECPKCGERYFEVSQLPKNVSSYKGLTANSSIRFKHFINAIDSDLRLRHFEQAYVRAEQEKTNYGDEAVTYLYCALTYFFATDIDQIVQESARKILIYLEDSEKRDAKSPSFKPIASMIAFRYSRAIEVYISLTRDKKPIKPQLDSKEMSPEQKTQLEDEYTQTFIGYKKQLFDFIREYETCFKIYPYKDFYNNAINEICGHNGTAWLDLKPCGTSFFSKKEEDGLIEGFFWGYYKIENNLPEMNDNFNRSPLGVLKNLLAKMQKLNSRYEEPEILVGTWNADRPETLKKRLTQKAVTYWLIVVSAFLGGLVMKIYLIPVAIICTIAYKFNEVQKNINRLMSGKI